MDIITLVWIFAVGVCAAIAIVYYNSRFLGKLVRALIEIDATSPESAMTMEELNVKMTPALKSALRPGKSLHEIVIKVSEDRYYIEPSKVSMAKSKYRSKDNSLLFAIIWITITLLISFILTVFFPDFLHSLASRITNLFTEGVK